ncbi:MAG: hypothetical protein K5846_02590 [Bacteroidales bacterium]|nr:hypothetical protein [Bacteroidales bacterium]
MTEKTIGELIENEVRKNQWNITEFAEAINCKRSNVYNIFRRNNMDIQLLARISKVLKHNYFQDLADNPDLAVLCADETGKDKTGKDAVSQFFEVMPGILTRMGLSNCITFFKDVSTDGNPLPDMILPDYLVCFTIGERWVDKAHVNTNPYFKVKTLESEDGFLVDIIDSEYGNSTMIDVKLDYKTEEEWESVMRFLKDNCLKYVKLPKRMFNK